MDDLLAKIASQTVTFAIRSGIGVASSFAIGQCTRYIRAIRGSERTEIMMLKDRLDIKIKVVSPAIDLVEILAARGNTSLESAMALTKSLREDIESLGVRLLSAAEAEEKHKGTRKKGQHDKDTAKKIIAEIKDLTKRIEDAVPLISLSVTASGASLSTAMPESVSPSRLLQASTILTIADQMYMQNPFHERQVGNAFTLTLYQLFAGHAHRTGPKVDEFTWQEVAFKCKVKILRVPLHYGGSEADNDLGAGQPEQYMRGVEKTDEYAYELRIVEDLDDGRVHEDEGEPFDEVQNAGRRLSVPIHQISKIFYTNSGKLLGIDSITPVLLLKRNPLADPPRRLLERIGRYERDDDEDDLSEADGPSTQLHDNLDANTSIHHEPHNKKWDFPEHLDKEWLAFELWQEPADSDEEDEDDEDDEDEELEASTSKDTRKETNYSISSLIPGFSNLLRGKQTTPPPKQSSKSVSIRKPNVVVEQPTSYQRGLSGLSSPSLASLSLLECLLRLAGLQNYQQTSHLFVHDELLNLFLSDAYSDEKSRRKERATAKKKIGFDPFGTPAPPRRGVEFNPTVSVLGQAADFRGRLARGGTPLDEDSFHEDDDISWVQEDSPSRVPPRTIPHAQHENPFQGSSPAHSTKSSIRSPAFTSNSIYYSPTSWGASDLPPPMALPPDALPSKLQAVGPISSRLRNEVRGQPPASDNSSLRRNAQR
ncbi:hypothetical protein TWF192_009477 [Orbilia oligospora]|uniref:Ran-specific GTPase-activating protein 30 n=1 Tax=Orbilia oligospora TaxID=2813651 RepID=A0A6G1LZQ5_ORBOL|nr:hypothetical protein TWF191_009339 [Orbilia oligospora]KAF3223051.1 hypothetical protein TWF679_004249 [Orbilia oligospora]KAF3240383.1 hypothetical protein TWF192_009477 [Orbilia oligospora]